MGATPGQLPFDPSLASVEFLMRRVFHPKRLFVSMPLRAGVLFGTEFSTELEEGRS